MKPVYSKTIEKPQGFQFARWSAGAKAFEDFLPPDRRVIDDPLARYYAGQAGMKMVAMMRTISPSLREAIVLRARYFDDQARQGIVEGCRQVVLLGAGYDSRYLRLPEFRQVRIFEVDLESTQVIKKALTRRLLGRLPANVTYIAADLSRDALLPRLKAAGCRPHLKTLFIWEGVTLFLNQDIIEETLGRLASLGAGHRVIFDFVPPDLVAGETGHQGNRDLLQLCAGIQEPLTFGCLPTDMNSILQGLGYAKVKIIGLQEASRIYRGTDQIEDSYCFATAEVGGADFQGSGRVGSEPDDSLPAGWLQRSGSRLLVPAGGSQVCGFTS